MKTQPVKLDDFLNEQRIRYDNKDQVKSYIDNAFNLQLIENEILRPLREKKTVDKNLVLLDMSSDKFTVEKKYLIDQETVVIIEGVLLFRKPLDRYFDMRIYLDINFEEMKKRALKRDEVLFGYDVINRYERKYIPVQKWYMKKYKPWEKSDIVIDNNDFKHPVIVKILNNN